jgi:tRNA pseudouridine55 synthase
MNGVLIIDKPAGLTSHDVVHRARRILGERSIGHLGTLDPMATGVLPLVVGTFTRLAQFYVSSEKVYEGVIRFGFSTDTYDAEGDPTSEHRNVVLGRAEIELLAARFRGVIEQIPPPFSAKKINGVPAYKMARRNQEVRLKPVSVEIKEFEIVFLEGARIRFRARVASGTYMRSIAHEMGQALGCGAHLESLRRTAVAEFSLDEANTLEQLTPAAGSRGLRSADIADASRVRTTERNKNSLQLETAIIAVAEVPEAEKQKSQTMAPMFEECFVHPRKLLPHLPCVTADEQTAARIRSGRTVNLPELSRARQVKVFASQRDLIAIATRIAGTLFHPKLVLCGPKPEEV